MSKANDTAALIEKIGKCSESLIIISEQDVYKRQER